MGRTRICFVTVAVFACTARSRAGSGPNQGGAAAWVVVGGAKQPKLHQIGSWWAQGRLVVAMGHNSECSVVVASVCASSWPMLGAAVNAMEVEWWWWLGTSGEIFLISEGGGSRTGW